MESEETAPRDALPPLPGRRRRLFPRNRPHVLSTSDEGGAHQSLRNRAPALRSGGAAALLDQAGFQGRVHRPVARAAGCVPPARRGPGRPLPCDAHRDPHRNRGRCRASGSWPRPPTSAPYGLYAPMNCARLQELGVGSVFGGRVRTGARGAGQRSGARDGARASATARDEPRAGVVRGAAPRGPAGTVGDTPAWSFPVAARAPWVLRRAAGDAGTGAGTARWCPCTTADSGSPGRHRHRGHRQPGRGRRRAHLLRRSGFPERTDPRASHRAPDARAISDP